MDHYASVFSFGYIGAIGVSHHELLTSVIIPSRLRIIYNSGALCVSSDVVHVIVVIYTINVVASIFIMALYVPAEINVIAVVA
jgi:hypothetical protein